MKIESRDVLHYTSIFIAPKTSSPMKHEQIRNFSTRGGKESVYLDYANIKKAFNICHSLNNRDRQHILSFFEEENVLTAAEIADKTYSDLDVTEEHLKIMVSNNVLNIFWQANEKYYSPNESQLLAIKKLYTDLND